MLRLRLLAVLGSLDQVNALVRCLAAEATLSGWQAYRLRLAAEELFTNIVRHGRGMAASSARVVVEGGVTAEDVWIRFIDTAEPFDPFRTTGALGIRLVRCAVDSASHIYDGGTNRTTFRVSRAERSEVSARERWSECV